VFQSDEELLVAVAELRAAVVKLRKLAEEG
jgi:hypothetical protein